jgi:glycosyltransferase involved in cell wall biosynthesis
VIPHKGKNAVASGRIVEIAQLLEPVDLGPLPENPLVSVLIGNYNYASFLGEAIQSVLSQTYTKFEMIVCDDGSTDKSCEVVEQYAQRDSRVRLIRQQNGGQASAWNTAYRACRGEIICFLDADDRYLPEKVEVVVRALRSYPDSGFVGHRMYRIDVVGRRDGVVPATDDPPFGWYGPFVLRSGSSPPAMAFGSALCLRRQISELIFPLPERLRICADEAVTTLGPLMTPLIGISAPLAEYRYHGRNSWNSPQLSPESMDRFRDIQRKMWEVSREYLGTKDPELVEAFPSFDECPGTLLHSYLRARRQTWGGALAAYRKLLRAEAFLTIRPAWRWFWRFSILLPPPAFRYALGPSGLRQFVWKAREARRRLFAS